MSLRAQSRSGLDYAPLVAGGLPKARPPDAFPTVNYNRLFYKYQALPAQEL
ncbi:MAG: hypothetical protein V4635_00950 [Bacteroidota bacterium]